MTTDSTSTDDATRRDGSRLSEGLGPAPERAEWVRAWFAKRYADSGVFDDGAEALTLEAACQLVADAQAAERERCALACEHFAAVAWAQWQCDADPIEQGRAVAAEALAAEIRGPNVRVKPPAEAGSVSLVRDDARCAADQAYAACRSGSA
jgi:hypothetical protein